MDKILIAGLKIDALIGINAWERKIKQKLLMDLELSVDCSKAATTDQIADAVDYKSLSDQIMAWVKNSNFQLIESLAEHIAHNILQNFIAVTHVKLRITKPHILSGIAAVGIEIERGRA